MGMRVPRETSAVYHSTYVRYERRGDRVVPVRVTKQWVTTEVPNRDNRKEPTKVRAFKVVRVSELRRMPVEPLDPRDNPPEPWTSGGVERVESRERLLTLGQKGIEDSEPVVREAGYDQCWLPFVADANPPAYKAGWTLENGNGWLS